MKIGITTFWQSNDNYGQQMQCFALQTYLRENGHDAYLIRYSPLRPKRPLWRRIASALKYRLTTSWAERRRRSDLVKHNEEQNKKRLFSDFRSENLKSTDVVYHTIDELRQNPPVADAYITGSDQVWHDSLMDRNNTAMYLDFGGPTIRRISYAASIGREIRECEMDKFVSLLRHFDHISVREHQSKELLQRLGFSKAVVMIDPTLLLSPAVYNRIGGKVDVDLSGPYAFFYVLNIRSSAELYWNCIDKYLEEQGLEVKSVASSGYLPAREFIPGVSNIPATIPEWLSLMRHATVVFTTSFHGVVFCLLYHRSFYAILLNNEFAKANDRLTSLLGTCGLTRRIIANEHDAQTLDTTPIDWADVDARLATLRQSAQEFLREALS